LDDTSDDDLKLGNSSEDEGDSDVVEIREEDEVFGRCAGTYTLEQADELATHEQFLPKITLEKMNKDELFREARRARCKFVISSSEEEEEDEPLVVNLMDSDDDDIFGVRGETEHAPIEVMILSSDEEQEPLTPGPKLKERNSGWREGEEQEQTSAMPMGISNREAFKKLSTSEERDPKLNA